MDPDLPLPRADETNKGGIQIIESSFTPDSQWVKRMRGAVADNKVPLPFYENIQGALDYNDHKQGPPSLDIIARSGERINFGAYLNTSGTEQPAAIVISNFIGANDRGLSPHDITQAEHKGGTGTLGQHGIGTSVAATFMLSDRLCTAITFRSKDKHGWWKGEVKMEKRHRDQDSPVLVLHYERLSKAPPGAEKTEITIVNPAPRLTEMLGEIPKYFLPFNPRYEFSTIPDASQIVPNKLTVFAPNAQNDYKGQPDPIVFSNSEITHMSVSRLLQKATEPVRAEILPREIVGGNGNNYHSAYVDGLRLYTYQNFALGWSFYWPEVFSGYGPRRSSDSTRMEGEVSNIVSITLGKCTDAGVFAQVMRGCIASPDCVEGKIRFEDISPSPKTREAIVKAWEEISDPDKSGAATLITTNDGIAEMARSDGRKVVVIHSTGLASAIRAFCGVEAAESKLGVREAQLTWEMMMISNNRSDVGVVAARTSLFDFMAHHKAKISITDKGIELLAPEQGKPILEYDSYFDLPSELTSFTRDLLALCGKDMRLDIYAGQHGKGQLFQFDIDEIKSSSTKTGFKLKKAEALIPPGQKLRIVITPNKKPGTYAAFLADVQAELPKVSNGSGGIEMDTLVASGRMEAAALSKLLSARKQELARLGAALDTTSRKITAKNGADSAAIVRLPHPKDNMRLGIPDEGGGDGPEPLMAVIRRIVNPNMRLSGLPFKLDSEYLIGHFDRDYAQADFARGYVPTDEITYERSSGPKLSIRLGLRKGTESDIVFPPGYEPASYFHPQGEQQIRFMRLPDHGLWGMKLDADIPPGLEIYFQKSPENTTAPLESDWDEIAELVALPDNWRRLIGQMNRDTRLTTKEKQDIIIAAWTRTFTYISDSSLEKVYGDFEADNIAEQIIDKAMGNCGFCAKGLLALNRAAGIPSNYVSGYMADPVTGNIDDRTDRHAFVRSYIDGRWVYIEPQSGYIDPSVKEAGFDSRYNSLINALPRRKFYPKALLQGSTEIAVQVAVTTAALAAIPTAAAAIGFIAGLNSFGPDAAPSIDNAITASPEITALTQQILKTVPWLASTAALLGVGKFFHLLGKKQGKDELKKEMQTILQGSRQDLTANK